MSVTNLVYRIAADSGPFAKELQKAERDVQKFQRKAVSNVTKVGKAFGAVGVAAGAALAVALRGSINLADETAKMSQRIGVSTENISAMSYALELSGSSAEAFEKTAAKVSQASLDAARGGSVATKSMERYGISLRDSEGSARDTMDVLMDMSDVFSQMPDGPEKTALAMEWMGKSGREMIPLLNAGREGIAEMREEAESLGRVISTETAQSAERFNDNLTRLKGAGKGFVNQVMTQSLPVLESYSARLVASANDSNKLSRATEITVTAMKLAASAVEIVIASFTIAGEAIGATVAIAFSAGKSIGEIFTALRNNVGAVGRALMQAARGDFQGAWETIKEAGAEIAEPAREGVEAQKAIFSQARKEITELVTSTKDNIVDIWSGAAPEVEASTAKISNSMNELAQDEADDLARRKELAKKKDEQRRKDEEAFKRDIESRRNAVLSAIKTEEELLEEGLNNIKELRELNAIDESVFIRARERLIEQYDPILKKEKELEEQAKRTAESLAAEGRRLEESLLSPYERYERQLEKLQRLREADAIDEVTHLKAKQAAWRDLKDEMQGTGDVMRDLGSAAADELFGAFETFLFDPMNASFEDMVGNFAKSLAKMALEAAKQQAIQALLSGATGAVTGGAGADAPVQMATGGFVQGPGTATSDSIPARLSDGEYVVRAKAVERYGVGFMDAINRLKFNGAPRRFAAGGPVTAAPNTAQGNMAVTIINAPHDSFIEDYLTSHAGERVIINVLRRNGYLAA